MQKQKGPCAFTAACQFDGPRVRLEGTNRVFCGHHARQLAIPLAAEHGGSEFARTEYRPARVSRNRRWATYAGVADMA